MYARNITGSIRQVRTYAKDASSLHASLVQKLKAIKDTRPAPDAQSAAQAIKSAVRSSSGSKRNSNNQNKQARSGQTNRSSFKGSKYSKNNRNNNRYDNSSRDLTDNLGSKNNSGSSGVVDTDAFEKLMKSIDASLLSSVKKAGSLIESEFTKPIEEEESAELKALLYDAFEEFDKLEESENILQKETPETKAQYIARKLNNQQPEVSPTLQSAKQGLDIVNGVKKLMELTYVKQFDPVSGKMVKSEADVAANYKLSPLSTAQLEVSKSKMGFDTKSRLLRALDQITRKRGFQISETKANTQPILPASTSIYPFSNPILPNTLARPLSDFNKLNYVSQEEIKATLDATVRGIRNELPRNQQKSYETERARVNAEVVANSLNSNAQLQVSDLHTAMGSVFLGKGGVKDLPAAINPPKK